jgi:hypothetical protein
MVLENKWTEHVRAAADATARHVAPVNNKKKECCGPLLSILLASEPASLQQTDILV